MIEWIKKKLRSAKERVVQNRIISFGSKTVYPFIQSSVVEAIKFIVIYPPTEIKNIYREKKRKAYEKFLNLL
jgi:hypothetical protein